MKIYYLNVIYRGGGVVLSGAFPTNTYWNDYFTYELIQVIIIQ